MPPQRTPTRLVTLQSSFLTPLVASYSVYYFRNSQSPSFRLFMEIDLISYGGVVVIPTLFPDREKKCVMFAASSKRLHALAYFLMRLL